MFSFVNAVLHFPAFASTSDFFHFTCLEFRFMCPTQRTLTLSLLFLPSITQFSAEAVFRAYVPHAVLQAHV